MTAKALRLAAYDLFALVEPEFGGLVASLGWTHRGRRQDLLYAPAGALPTTQKTNGFGVWPMVPFANRAFGAVLDDGERRWNLPVNEPEPGNNLHGFGWQMPWRVEEAGAAHAVLVHTKTEGADPYRYSARLAIRLEPGSVHLALEVTNRAADVLPFGIGLHPWFACAPDTTLRMAASGALTLGPSFRPAGHGKVPREGDFSDGRRVFADTETAWSFTFWDGRAEIRTPSLGLAIAMEASETLCHPVLWAPPRAPFVCLEPQSHAIGAPSDKIARDVTPLKRLAPGETLSGWMRLRPSAA